MTPVKAIRKKCLDCCGNAYKQVRLCPCTDCPLWAYRLGKRPNNNGKEDENSGFPEKSPNPLDKPPKIYYN